MLKKGIQKRGIVRRMPVKEFTNSIRKEISINQLELSREELFSFIEKKAIESKELAELDIDEINKVVRRAFFAVNSDLSILEPYINNESISEIMVNGYKNIFIEKNGKIKRTKDEFFDVEELEEVIRRLAGSVHREINEMVPIVDARTKDGARVNSVYKNIALGGPILTIRRFPKVNITMKDLVLYKTITLEAAMFLEELLICGYNFFISGGTSSGKTTFLNALTGLIPADERVIIIEDSAELRPIGISNLVRMESRTTSDGRNDIQINELIKTSLRMRPDRIIIGEIRDGKALLDMLNGLNTGHSGLCTGHGNSSAGMLKRMEALYMQEANFPLMAIDEQIAEGLDIIIHIKRFRNNIRKVSEISEIFINEDGRLALNKLFALEAGKLMRTKNELINKEKLDIERQEMDDEN